jgi:CRISPR-associated protein Cas2
MRTMVLFDLPTDTAEDKRNYAHFRKFLVREGFLMLQYSVYAKLAVNKTVATQIRQRIRKNKPLAGNVAILDITEKQFAGIEWILGGKNSNLLDTVEKLTIFEEE